jgi:serine protease Do
MRTLGLGIAFLAGLSFSAPGGWAQGGAGTHGFTINTNGSRLGIGVADVTPDRAKALKMKDERGAEVTMVRDDSPASRAGLKPGDVILDYDGKPVQGWENLQRLVSDTPAGTDVKIGVWRDGQYITLTATTGRRTVIVTPGGTMDFGGFSVSIPPMPPMPPMPEFNIDIPKLVTLVHSSALGMDEESLQPDGQLAEFFGVKDGVLVTSVARDSAADKAGFKAGDVIVKMGDAKVSNTRDVSAALRAARPDGSLPVTVVRNKKEVALSVMVEDRRNARRF